MSIEQINDEYKNETNNLFLLEYKINDTFEKSESKIDTSTRFVGLNSKNLKKLILINATTLEDKFNGKVNDSERIYANHLFSKCATIMKQIYLFSFMLIFQYKNMLSSEELNNYSDLLTIVKNDETKWNNIEDLKKTYSKINNYIKSDDYTSKEEKNSHITESTNLAEKYNNFSLEDLQSEYKKIQTKLSIIKNRVNELIKNMDTNNGPIL